MKTTKTGPTIEQLRVDLAKVTREREAYKKAKQENDDRFMRERDDARAELARMTAERDELRAIVEGRATPPTAAEIEAHKTARGEWLHSYPLGRVGGRWTFTVDLCAAPARAVAYNGAELAEGEIVEVRDDGEGNDYYFPLHPDAHWLPFDANGRPCAWPKVTP